ncbi:disease resistance protein RGA2-like [Setaria italica]|uniref:disease resistance protein RGA2-like n=1 Tax=Setaria italica TaxID=4555 RepID=UPI000BE4DF84|nr:disease resistance protein RGA2-like [Setaria italica]
MAESLLLPMVSRVAGKAADVLVQSITRMWGVDDDRRKLERHLLAVQSLLADAEVKSENNPAVRRWMKDLNVVAYRADDVLDDFQYEALHREAQSHRSMTSKVLSSFTLHNRLVFRHKASRDLKNVLDKIDELVMEMNKFGFMERAEVPHALYRQTHSVLDESVEIFGRDEDKEALVKLLIDQQDQQNVQVLPIIGMGGLGKTTLVKMVYSDYRVQKHFDVKMWYCVSENFEATAVVRSVIQLATNGTCSLPDTIELLRGKLQEVIGQKRYLLVLDDVWNEEQQKWDDDLKPLLCSSIGGFGSMIVVTSRSRQVASIMGTLPPYELACLSEDASWELFSQKAFSKGVQEQEEFVMFGRCIVNKCKGLPLALKTMGGLMSSKQQVQDWEAIAESNISDTSRGKDEVLSILKLSYRHLSSEMKQCFAFCAAFPKDYLMEKDKLVQLWIANSYIIYMVREQWIWHRKANSFSTSWLGGPFFKMWMCNHFPRKFYVKCMI